MPVVKPIPTHRRPLRGARARSSGSRISSNRSGFWRTSTQGGAPRHPREVEKSCLLRFDVNGSNALRPDCVQKVLMAVGPQRDLSAEAQPGTSCDIPISRRVAREDPREAVGKRDALSTVRALLEAHASPHHWKDIDPETRPSAAGGPPLVPGEDRPYRDTSPDFTTSTRRRARRMAL